jgi:hypothetical protein
MQNTGTQQRQIDVVWNTSKFEPVVIMRKRKDMCTWYVYSVLVCQKMVIMRKRKDMYLLRILSTQFGSEKIL